MRACVRACVHVDCVCACALICVFESERIYVNNCNNNNDAMPHIDVKLIEMCVKHLISGKAAGADRLVAEHIVHAAPSLIIHLKLLFSLFLSHSYVPDAFSFGIIIPIVKDKSGDPSLLDNYRPITLSPVISKLFENVLMIFRRSSVRV